MEEEGLLSHDGSASHLISPTARLEKKAIVGMLGAINHPDYRKAVFAVIMVMIAQQLTGKFVSVLFAPPLLTIFKGINSIIMYGVGLLADLLKSNSALLNLAVSGLNIAVTAGCAPLVDKLGRKTCLMFSICGMGVSSILLAVGIRNSFSLLSAIAVVSFVASFGVGLGPIPFILSSELVGQEAVNATQAWALGANWISTFIVAQFFPVVNAFLGKGIIYFVFAGIAAFFAVFVSVFVPETKVCRVRVALVVENIF